MTITSQFNPQGGAGTLADGRRVQWSARGIEGTTAKYGGHPMKGSVSTEDGKTLFEGGALDAETWLNTRGFQAGMSAEDLDLQNQWDNDKARDANAAENQARRAELANPSLEERNLEAADREQEAREDLAETTDEYTRKMREVGRADLVRGFA